MAMNEIYEAERMVLGRDKINDFTTSKSTDYRKAYTVYNTIYSNVIKVPKSDQVNFSKKLNDRVFSAASVNYKQHTTTPAEIIKQRDGQDFTLNDSDRKRLEYAKTLQNSQDLQRRKQLKEQDYLIQQNYQKFNQRLQYLSK